MISSIIDLVLLSALAATSGCVLLMYRRLRKFDVLQGEAAREFARTADALERARSAFGALQSDGDHMTVALSAKLNEARMVLNDIEDAMVKSAASVKSQLRAAAEEAAQRRVAAASAGAADAGWQADAAAPRVEPPSAASIAAMQFAAHGATSSSTVRLEGHDTSGAHSMDRDASRPPRTLAERLKSAALARCQDGSAGDPTSPGGASPLVSGIASVPQGNSAASGRSIDEVEGIRVPPSRPTSELPAFARAGRDAAHTVSWGALADAARENA